MVTRYFHKGDKVFAKMRGYPAWPARIDAVIKVSTSPAKALYSVFFYGTHQTAKCKAQFLVDFEENKDRLGHNKKSFSFYDAMMEIADDPDVTHDPAESQQQNKCDTKTEKNSTGNKPGKRKQSAPKSETVKGKSIKKEGKKMKQESSEDKKDSLVVVLTHDQVNNLLSVKDVPQSLRDKIVQAIGDR